MEPLRLATVSYDELRQALDRVIELEVALLDPRVRTNRERVATLLHRDFIEHGASGRVWDRTEIMRELAAEDPAGDPITTRGMRSEADEESIVVTYQSITDERTCQRCSIWRRTVDDDDPNAHDIEHGWQIVFHQGTEISAPRSTHP